eukprot:TRINITY_DN16664_c0_g1_i4.p1 TRINITY_DN16664_c0_g1~~TRINITY_DN16664_c0_g1_i4.p1  ORF type:complete len:158 (+),score=4.55 TRINITY_DN16664_c0_g1_i4:166-639(+)
MIKNEYMRYIKPVDIKSLNFGAVAVSKTLFDTDKDVLYVFCYIQPEGSPYYAYFDCVNGVMLLEEYLTDCLLTYGDMHVLLCGDLNSRISNLSHHCEGNNGNGVFDFQFTSHPPSVDRCSQDTGLNNYGKLLINMCTALDLCVLNGVCKGDRQGYQE